MKTGHITRKECLMVWIYFQQESEDLQTFSVYYSQEQKPPETIQIACKIKLHEALAKTFVSLYFVLVLKLYF